MSKEAYNKIIFKLQKLDEYVKYLRETQKVNKNKFIEDYHFFGLAERYLQLSIEVLLDVGKILVIIKGLKRPEENQEIFSMLYDEKIISEKTGPEFNGHRQF